MDCTAISEIDPDHYLFNPWDSPADRLDPVMDELLGGTEPVEARAPILSTTVSYRQRPRRGAAALTWSRGEPAVGLHLDT